MTEADIQEMCCEIINYLCQVAEGEGASETCVGKIILHELVNHAEHHRCKVHN